MRLQLAAIEPRIGRPFRGRRPVLGGDGDDLRHREAVPRGRLEGGDGEAVPGGLARAGRMEDAGVFVAPAGADSVDDGEDRIGEVRGRGRAAALVGDHAQRARLACGAEHGADEVLAVGRVDPGGAQHDRARVGREHRAFAGELRLAVDAGRAGRVVLHVGRALGAVEHVVGRDVDQRDAGLRRQPRQLRRSGGIRALGRFAVALGCIDGGPGGGVHHQRRGGSAEGGGDRLRPVEIECRPSHPDQRPVAPGPVERRRELARAAGDEDRAGHSVNQRSVSRSRGKSWSLSDSTAPPGSTGQGRARSGSSQITPRSEARS